MLQPMTSDQLIDSLRDLRNLGNDFRCEMYWNVQRLKRTRRRSVQLRDSCWRRRRLRLCTDDSGEPLASVAPAPHAA
jgi:hypothetical protein